MKPADLASQVRSSAFWAAMHSGAKHGMDLFVFLLLARWLSPQAFGLMALVSTVLVVATMLAELGLAEALVQRKRLAGVAVDTAFWMLLGLGCLLTLGLAGAAVPLVRLFEQPELAPLVWALCPLVIASSLNAVPQALMQRALRFRPLALRGMAGTLAGGATGVTMAVAGADVWSLAAQQLVSALVGLTLLWRQSEWRPRWRFSPVAARRLAGFGRHVVITRCLNVVASKVDDAVIGFALGPISLGVYAVAGRLRLALEQLFCQGIDAVALSAFSRLTSQREALGQAYLAATRTAITLALPVFVSAAWLSPVVLPSLIGSKWNAAMAPLQVLLLAGLLQAFLHFNHAVFRAVGQPRRSWQLGLASLTLNVCLVTVAVRWGVLAVAWAYLLRVALIGPWGTVLACRELGLGVRRVGQTIASPLTAAMSAIALAAGVWWLLGEAWNPLAPGSEASRAWLAWSPAMLVYVAWLWLRSPALDALRHRHAASGSRNHKWGPAASRVSRPA